MQYIYKRLIEYCEYIKDPLKLYFQEKIENLYLKKDVMRVILQTDNQNKGSSEIPKVEILSNSFLKFSEIQDIKESQLQKGSSLAIDRPLRVQLDRHDKTGTDSFENYASTKLKKNLDLQMMMKVNDQLVKNDPNTGRKKNSSKFIEFVNNDSLVKDNLNNQVSILNSKLQARKFGSMIKG
jgi:hypothetical protein